MDSTSGCFQWSYGSRGIIKYLVDSMFKNYGNKHVSHGPLLDTEYSFVKFQKMINPGVLRDVLQHWIINKPNLDLARTDKSFVGPHKQQ
jgi:hypothetical protein